MQPRLEEIVAYITSGSFDVRFEMRRTNDTFTMVRLVVTSTDDVPDDLSISDYGVYIFVRMFMSAAEVCSLLHDLDSENGGGIDITDRFRGVSCPWSPSNMHYEFQKIHRGQWYGFQRRNYPARFYQAYQEVERDGTSGEEAELNAPGLPFFRSLAEAETYYLFDSVLESANPVRKVLQVVIDDRRAWIERISVGNTGLQISIRGVCADRTEVKLSGKRPGYIGVVSAVEAVKNGIVLEPFPAELHVCLSLGHEIVDQRYVSEQASLYAPTMGVSYERDQEISIEGIIRLRGEGVHHDYKEQFTPKIYDTVCAFANTEGGSLLIGIDDSGNIVGVEHPDDMRLQIENFLEDHLIGTVQRKYLFHTLVDGNGHEVCVMQLQVNEAHTKPIALRDRDKEKFYVRRDGSNRPMKREDFVHMLNQTAANSAVTTRSLLGNPLYKLR
jgi:hypothetical protein